MAREYFNYNKAVYICRELSSSQRFYGKVLEALLELDKFQIYKFDDKMMTNGICDILDFVMYLEQIQEIEKDGYKAVFEYLQ